MEHPDLEAAIGAFRETERALQQLLKEAEKVNETSARLATAEVGLADSAERLNGAADALRQVAAGVQELTTRVDASTAAYESGQPDKVLSAVSQAEATFEAKISGAEGNLKNLIADTRSDVEGVRSALEAAETQVHDEIRKTRQLVLVSAIAGVLAVVMAGVTMMLTL